MKSPPPSAACPHGWRGSAFAPSDAGHLTPGAVAQVLDLIRTEGIPALFVEPQLRSDVLDRAARDAGVRVGTIYSDIPGEPAGAYIEMMRFNARSLAEYLR